MNWLFALLLLGVGGAGGFKLSRYLDNRSKRIVAARENTGLLPLEAESLSRLGEAKRLADTVVRLLNGDEWNDERDGVRAFLDEQLLHLRSLLHAREALDREQGHLGLHTGGDEAKQLVGERAAARARLVDAKTAVNSGIDAVFTAMSAVHGNVIAARSVTAAGRYRVVLPDTTAAIRSIQEDLESRSHALIAGTAGVQPKDAADEFARRLGEGIPDE